MTEKRQNARPTVLLVGGGIGGLIAGLIAGAPILRSMTPRGLRGISSSSIPETRTS